jgi:hypothetical protein
MVQIYVIEPSTVIRSQLGGFLWVFIYYKLKLRQPGKEAV